MALSYVVIRDGLFQNKILVQYDLCAKGLTVLLKVMNPQNVNKWFTESELRKNNIILVNEMRVITSIGTRIGFLQTKFENGKIKFKFNPTILAMSEEQFKDALKEIDENTLSEDIMVATQYLQHRRTQQAEFKKIRPIEELVPQETIEQIQELQPKKIDKAFVSKVKPKNEVYIGTPVHTKSAKELHEAQKCDSNVCKFCAFGIEA